MLRVELHIVGDEQVKMAVAVVVEKAAAGAEADLCVQQACLPGYVGEGAVAVVSVKLVPAVVGAEHVFKAVVVIVANADTGGPAGIAQTGALRHVGKGGRPGCCGTGDWWLRAAHPPARSRPG